MGQRSGPPPFLTKTYELVDDESTNDVVSWGEKGDTFVVWKIAEFAKDLLPAYFKHNNFSSFVRQLNTYGFRKIVPDKWEFANENFKRGQKDLLAEIRRRKTTTPAKANGKSSASQGSSGEEGGSTSSSSDESSRNRSPSSLADLSGENAKLRRENEMLSSELARTQKQYDELVAFLSGHLKVDPLQILQHRPPDVVGPANTNSNLNDDGESEEEECRKVERDEGLRLFGVWFGNKRRRCHPYERDPHGDNHLSSTTNVAL